MDFKQYVSLLNSSITVLKGIGNKKGALFNKIGIFSVWDLLYFFPRAYDDRTNFYSIAQLPEGVSCCVSGVVAGPVIEKRIKSKMSLYILRIEDKTGFLTLKWFSSPYNRHKIRRGEVYSFCGVVSKNQSTKEMLVRDMEPYEKNELLGKILPVYSLTNGLTQNDFRRSVKFVLDTVKLFWETLPNEILTNNMLTNISEALREMHFPTNSQNLKDAKRRFAFEELFILCLAMRKMRSVNSVSTGVDIKNTDCVLEFKEKLPFELTFDQRKAIDDICMDLKKTVPMNRLIQGDVGSGKTVVAASCAYISAKNGYQTAVMAPTEILARQHYRTFNDFFKESGIRICLLTSGVKNKNKLIEDIKNFKYDIVIGTHALIQDKVSFANLGVCITDEQHRFGVKQRASLANSGNNPHVLVMSATPIPRTLSLVVYGDLDISVISTLPGSRQKTDTFCIGENMRNRLNGFIEKQVEEGHQCFVVCPLIEASESIEANSGKQVFDYIKDIFPKYNIAFLHGKMSVVEKDEIMNDFYLGKYEILVSTTVIEVGIDIPNATLMIVENAERFGLSQLHQLRGRVGRGSFKSYCILISDCKTEEAKERMKIMCRASDGFEIADYDLKLRGCGEFFGTRQHGLPELKVANLFTDSNLIEEAKRSCDTVLARDSELSCDEYFPLRLRIEKMFKDIDYHRIFN